jgi:FkbM family methyltransferase
VDKVISFDLSEGELFEELKSKARESSRRKTRSNFDEGRFGSDPKVRAKFAARVFLGKFKRFVQSDARLIREALDSGIPGRAKTELSEIYRRLGDRYSKNVLLELYLQRIFRFEEYKSFRNNSRYWEERATAEKLVDPKVESMRLENLGWHLNYLDLRPIGFPLGLYDSPVGVDLTFVKEQYRYVRDGVRVEVEPGDVSIDGGSCWGDTALYMAEKGGPNGKVFAVEFVPNNVAILKKNLALNPSLEARVEVVENPLWETSGKRLYMLDRGPASRVYETQEPGTTAIDTLSIDDLVAQRGLQKVDFIKMDIEGAELPSLKGAIETIKRFRPKLAICVYHRPQDWLEISRFVESLGLGYKMYLDHFTVFAEETVLFCTAR